MHRSSSSSCDFSVCISLENGKYSITCNTKYKEDKKTIDLLLLALSEEINQEYYTYLTSTTTVTAKSSLKIESRSSFSIENDHITLYEEHEIIAEIIRLQIKKFIYKTLHDNLRDDFFNAQIISLSEQIKASSLPLTTPGEKHEKIFNIGYMSDFSGPTVLTEGEATRKRLGSELEELKEQLARIEEQDRYSRATEEENARLKAEIKRLEALQASFPSYTSGAGAYKSDKTNLPFIGCSIGPDSTSLKGSSRDRTDTDDSISVCRKLSFDDQVWQDFIEDYARRLKENMASSFEVKFLDDIMPSEHDDASVVIEDDSLPNITLKAPYGIYGNVFLYTSVDSVITEKELAMVFLAQALAIKSLLEIKSKNNSRDEKIFLRATDKDKMRKFIEACNRAKIPMDRLELDKKSIFDNKEDFYKLKSSYTSTFTSTPFSRQTAKL